MSSITTTTSGHPTAHARSRLVQQSTRRWLYPALAVGGLWGIALTYVRLAFTVTEDGHPFQHTADYWLTGLGLPLALSALVIVHAVHRLAEGRDARRGLWGVWIFTAPMIVFCAMFVDGLAERETSSWGPTYLLCVLLSDIGLGLLVAGLWRTGLLPRWTLATWWVGWFIGGPLSPPAAPLLLTVAYVAIAVQLHRATALPPRAHKRRPA